jgi:hypothetical protein
MKQMPFFGDKERTSTRLLVKEEGRITWVVARSSVMHWGVGAENVEDDRCHTTRKEAVTASETSKGASTARGIARIDKAGGREDAWNYFCGMCGIALCKLALLFLF